MKKNLQDAVKSAMRARDKARLETLRSLLSAIQYEEMQKGVDSLRDEETIALLKSELKKHQESLEFAEKSGRSELVDQSRVKIAIIEEFLPQQMSEEELRAAILTFRDANPDSQMGEIMKDLRERFQGAFDGKLASQLAKEVLAR